MKFQSRCLVSFSTFHEYGLQISFARDEICMHEQPGDRFDSTALSDPLTDLQAKVPSEKEKHNAG